MAGQDVFIILEAEDFGGGWCVMPVLIEMEAGLKALVANGFKGRPETAPYSAGRYRFSGTRVTGFNPTTVITVPQAGEYVLWARSKLYADGHRGTYLAEIGEWSSPEFGGRSRGKSDEWEWQEAALRIERAGPATVRLVDTRPEACCDVLLLTTDRSYVPVGTNLPKPEGAEDGPRVVRAPRAGCFRDRNCYSSRDLASSDKVEVFEIHHGPTTSYHGYFGDLDGDGKEEIILAFEDEHVEAFKADGKSLWRCAVAFPWQTVNEDNYRERGYKFYIPHDFRPNRADMGGMHIIEAGHVVDINGDGRKEFVFGWNPIYIIDAHAGRIVHERTLPGQAARMDLADLGGTGTRREIVVATKDAVEGRAYVHALDAELGVLWRTRVDAADIEHTLAVGDVDGDGKDEIVFTASENLYCIDHDGRIAWALRGRSAWGGFDFHSDKIVVEKLDDAPTAHAKIVLAEGSILNGDGSLYWRGAKIFEHDDVHGHSERCFDHGQTCAVAKVREDVVGKQVFFGERNVGNVYCFAADGTLLWKRGRYNGERVFVSDIVPINWSGRGRKEMLCRSLGIFDEYGNLIAWPPHVQCGACNLRVADMVGDERDEIVTTIGATTYIVANR